MKRTKIEIYLIVSDFVKKHGKEGAFTYIQENPAKAVKEFYENSGIKFTNVKFVEFDSNNWTHSCAYIRCTVEGSKKNLFDYGIIDEDSYPNY